MKGFRFYLVYLSIAVAAIACGKKKGFEAAEFARRTARGGSALVSSSFAEGLPSEPPEDKVWGEIGGASDEDFQYRIAGLLRATLPPDEIGFVSGFSDASTGVRFWGRVELAGGPLRLNMAPTSVVGDATQLRIVVWDSLTGTKGKNGDPLPEYALDFTRAASGTVSGDTAELQFEDAYGAVVVRGTFDSHFFQGEVSYVNRGTYGGTSTPRADVLGRFVIRTCGFFRCK